MTALVHPWSIGGSTACKARESRCAARDVGRQDLWHDSLATTGHHELEAMTHDQTSGRARRRRRHRHRRRARGADVHGSPGHQALLRERRAHRRRTPGCTSRPRSAVWTCATCGRSRTCSPLDREGFLLVRHETAVDDLYDDEAIAGVFRPRARSAAHRGDRRGPGRGLRSHPPFRQLRRSGESGWVPRPGEPSPCGLHRRLGAEARGRCARSGRGGSGVVQRRANRADQRVAADPRAGPAHPHRGSRTRQACVPAS